MQIISERHKVTDTWYELDFYKDGQVCLGFLCDENGNVMLDKLQPAAVKNLEWARENNLKSRVRKYSNTYTEPAVGKCECCGREVQLIDDYCGATECECGQWYAIGGYAINPPRMWEVGVE